MIPKRELAFLLGVTVATVAALSLFFPAPLEIVRDYGLIVPIGILAAAFANATAVGGGFLFVPAFLFIFQLPLPATVGLSFGAQTFGMSSGALSWPRSLIIPRVLIYAVVFSTLGWLVGSNWAIEPALVKGVFGWVSLSIGVAVILRARAAAESGNTDDSRAEAFTWGLGLATFLGGIVNAWITIGVGETLVLYLLFARRQPIERAIATGVALQAYNCWLGFIPHWMAGTVLWELLVLAGPAALIGGRYGSRLGALLERRAKKNASGRRLSPLQRMFVGITMVDGTVILLQDLMVR